MQPTKKQIILVIHEIESLIKWTSPKEKLNLDFKYFDARYHRSNIYGQLTGRSMSERARRLIKVCGTKCMYSDNTTENKVKDVDLSTKTRTFDGYGGNTPLENFVARFPEYTENIIDYIKGTTDKLNLTEMVDHKALKSLIAERELYIEKIKHFEFLLEVKNDTMTDFEFEAMHDNLYVMKSDVAQLTEGINEIEKYLKSKI